MAEQAEIRDLTSRISNSIDRGLKEFRYAAQSDNKNIRNIVKDISNLFYSQKRDISRVYSSIEESVANEQDQAEKISETNSLLNDTIALQGNIIAELKNIAFNIRTLTDNMSTLLGNQGYLGMTLSGGFNLLKTALATAGLAGLSGDTSPGGGGDVSPVKASGNLAQNQKEAYQAARAEGLSDSAAKILVSNMSGESLANPKDVHPDPSSTNPNQKAHGIVQWDDTRAAAIAKQFGKMPQDMSVAEQTKAAIWEMKNNPKYSKSWADLNNENLSDRERMYSVVKNYENPLDKEKATSERMGYLRGLSVDSTSTGKDGEKVLGNVPSGDIVALGKYLQGQGMNVSEHPSFGGVKGGHAKNSAHYSGRALDINGPPGVTEANDPVWGKKFDQLAQSLRSSGYKVIWRQPGHYDHLHVQVGGGTSDLYNPTQQELQNAPSQSPTMNQPVQKTETNSTVINQNAITAPDSERAKNLEDMIKRNIQGRAEVKPVNTPSANVEIPKPVSSVEQPVQTTNVANINNSYIKQAEVQREHEKSEFQQAMLESSVQNGQQIQQVVSDSSKQGAPMPWDYNKEGDLNLGPSWSEMISWSYPQISKKLKLTAFG